MEIYHLKITMIAGFFALLFWNVSAEAKKVADTMYHNGSILTRAGEQPIFAEAQASVDGFRGQGNKLDLLNKDTVLATFPSED
jgi:hypothetical protein